MNIKKSEYPCPICKKIIWIIGTDSKGRKIGSCGCVWKFRKTRSQKDIDRKYIKTPDGGLEIKK